MPSTVVSAVFDESFSIEGVDMSQDINKTISDLNSVYKDCKALSDFSPENGNTSFNVFDVLKKAKPLTEREYTLSEFQGSKKRGRATKKWSECAGNDPFDMAEPSVLTTRLINLVSSTNGGTIMQASPQKRNKFTKEEDSAIIEGMTKFSGNYKFLNIFNFYSNIWVPGRKHTQLQDRWKYLRQRLLMDTNKDS